MLLLQPLPGQRIWLRYDSLTFEKQQTLFKGSDTPGSDFFEPLKKFQKKSMAESFSHDSLFLLHDSCQSFAVKASQGIPDLSE